jgi:hypothetical protein
MHTHAIRLILNHDHPLPERIFTAQSKGRYVLCTAEMAFNELHGHLKRWATFALVRDQTYVCLLHEEHQERLALALHMMREEYTLCVFFSRAKKSSGLKAPDQFCLIRTSLDIPTVLICLCFPPGVTGQTRDEVFLALLGNINNNKFPKTRCLANSRIPLPNFEFTAKFNI